MKHLIAAIVIIFMTAASAFSGEVYGCIINETPASMHGTISSGVQRYSFAVGGNYVWCRKLPEGSYVVTAEKSRLHKKFSASWQKSIGSAGDEILHWVVKINEQDIE